MEIQLQDLIEQIKKDGVQAAEGEAERIINDAKLRADKIVEEARAQAERILGDAGREKEHIESSSQAAISQAGRNMLISFRKSVNAQLKAILDKELEGVYSRDGLKALILKAVETWFSKPDTESVEVLLNAEDLQLLERELLSAFDERARGGITLNASDSFDGGFRIGVNDQGAYYDYSSEAVAQMLSDYLDPKITRLLKEAE